MVLVIAFFIPVNFFTSSSGLTPVRGAILTTRSPLEPVLLTEEAVADYLGEDLPSINASISSLRTLPSLPVEGTLEISIPCLFAMLLTAGVARALLFESSVFASSLVLPTLDSSSDEEEDDD